MNPKLQNLIQALALLFTREQGTYGRFDPGSLVGGMKKSYREGGQKGLNREMMNVGMSFAGDLQATPGLTSQWSNAMAGVGRPAHQVALEQAVNSGDYVKVGQILDSIPPTDAYKGTMESLFRKYVPYQGTGAVSAPPPISGNSPLIRRGIF